MLVKNARLMKIFSSLSLTAAFIAATSVGCKCNQSPDDSRTPAQRVAAQTFPKTPDDSSNDHRIEILSWYMRHNAMMQQDSNRKKFNAWLSQFDRFKNKPLLEQLRAVDSAVDAEVTWVSDSVNYGRSEYYAPPLQILYPVASGDCDDHAILKYYAIGYLGLPVERRFVLSVDAIDSVPGIDHAVLLVDTSYNNSLTSVLILDNMDKKSDPQGKVVSFYETRYKPGIMTNEKKLAQVSAAPKN